MEIGIFARTFARPTLAETLDAVLAHDLRCIQFNLACAGLPTLPDALDPAQVAAIGRTHRERRISIAAVSGTFNMIHPDPDQRREGLRRLDVLAGVCRDLGTNVVTLCTGTRDPTNMWRRHPDNETPDAWRDLLAALDVALISAEAHDVVLAVEPEVANVVDSGRKARRLLDEVHSPRLKVVFDGANLFHGGELPRMREILAEAIESLGPDIVIAHAKDLSHDGEAGHEAAGEGLLDYDFYLAQLQRVRFAGPLILHSLTESQVDSAVTFLRRTLAAVTSAAGGAAC